MALVLDPTAAYTYGACVEAAYRLFKDGVLHPNLADALLPTGWSAVTGLVAIDHTALKSEAEFFGLIARATNESHVVVAIRGTDTFLEWLVDAEFLHHAFPAAPGAGRVEDGFYQVYRTLRCSQPDSDVVSYLRTLPAGTSVTIAGHSLGAAVATLLAADVAAQLPTLELALYTYASPKPGDQTFSAYCDLHVPNHFRIVNLPDIVPRLPPGYVATGIEFPLDSTSFPQIAYSVACYHTLTTYLWLLDNESSFGLGTCARTP